MDEPASAPARPARCLTTEEIALVLAAAPGQAPAELARHLAGCALCQERALFGPGSRRKSARQVKMPSWRGALLLLFLVLVALGGFLYTLQVLIGRLR
jgi:hypothetical protein